MPIKKTKQQILEQICERNLKYPPILPVDPDFEYDGGYSKIDWKCDANHIFLTTFKNILKGHGCKKCGMKLVGKKNTKDTSLLLQRLKERNIRTPDKQIRIKDISEYSGMTKKMTWLCDQDHEWQATPKTVLQQDHHCRKCADIENANNQRFNNADIEKRIHEHNEEYPHKKIFLVDLSNYETTKTKIPVKCENGHTWETELGFIIDSHVGCPICSTAGFSLKSIEWLDDIAKKGNIHIQHALNGGEHIIKNSKYRADGYCKETNTIYEFHGDMYHGNPDKYNQNDIREIDGKTYGDCYKDTIIRDNFIKEQGYNLIVMWENTYNHILKTQKGINQMVNFLSGLGCKVSTETDYDIFIEEFDMAINYQSLVLHTHDRLKDVNYHKKIHEQAIKDNVRLITILSNEWLYTKAKVKDSLRYFVGCAEKGVAGRKTDIKEIPWSQAKIFLDKYHLLNSGTSTSIAIGAFYKRKLIAVMTFGKPSREQGRVDYYEMTRFVTDKLTHPGVASKMFKHAVKQYDFEKIIAFVDKRWFTGGFKTLSGFKIIHESNPTKWYTDGKKLFHRRFITKKQLIDKLNLPQETTKDSMMAALGYKTIYDCGKLKLEWNSESS